MIPERFADMVTEHEAYYGNRRVPGGLGAPSDTADTLLSLLACQVAEEDKGEKNLTDKNTPSAPGNPE